ncbi:MAG: DNRLRE domain-containing protein [Pyrinomonadaceae bacterium]|nr:DNRLRE domain-containing protein [Pyrinomonadaceae bacterium]
MCAAAAPSGSAWDESSITANNLPALGSLATTTAQIGEDRKGKFLVIDVTALVQQWLGDDGQGTNGLPNNGLALVAHPADATTPAVANITFDSKENSQTSHEPQLNVQFKRAADGLQRVEHDTSLMGDGTSASPLGVAAGGISSVHLANDSVTGEKIADGAVTSTELADGSVTSPKINAPL